MKFTAPVEGLYLFGVTATTSELQLQSSSGPLASMHSDTGTSSTLATVLLREGETVQAIPGTAAGLSFLGTGLHSTSGLASVHVVSGTSSQPLSVENIRQPIIMQSHAKQGEQLSYEAATGCVQVHTGGTYMVSLTLSSDGPAYASLTIGSQVLGLGDDGQGQGMISNSAIVTLEPGDCVLPRLEPLSKIHGHDRWSQLVVATLPGDDDEAFSYGLSLPFWNPGLAPEPVGFDVPIHPNNNFHQGVFSIQEEDYNPRRFYLVLVHAFLASGSLTVELGDDVAWKSVAGGQADTTDRRMVSITTIVEMDNIWHRMRVTATGLLDEGDNRFATFSAARIGKLV